MSVAVDTYRKLMGRMPTGVTILTTRTGEGHEVMTANSVMSLSLEPVLIAASIGRGSRWLGAVRQSTTFSVNILAAEQAELGRWCASPLRHLDPEAVLGHPHRLSPCGALHFEEAVAVLDCRVSQSVVAGDHELLIAAVEDAHLGPGSEPLVFLRSHLSGLAAALRPDGAEETAVAG